VVLQKYTAVLQPQVPTDFSISRTVQDAMI